MFEEFYLDGYKQIYGYYKDHGVELIVHHSDSYAATLVPDMINMGIDIWQGVIDHQQHPRADQEVRRQDLLHGRHRQRQDRLRGLDQGGRGQEVKRACDENGKLYFIPSASQGLAVSTFPGVYEATTEAIAEYSKQVF